VRIRRTGEGHAQWYVHVGTSHRLLEGTEERMDKMKSRAIMAAVAALLLFVLIGVGLFLLGDSRQSALQKLRDIAIIFIVLAMVLNVILLAAITAALGFLAIQLKDRIIPMIEDIRGRIIPMLEELTGTVKRVRGTTNFISEEAVKPIISVAGTYSRLRTMTKTVNGKRKKPPKAPVYASAEQAAHSTQPARTVQSVERVESAPSVEPAQATQTAQTDRVYKVPSEADGSR